MIQAVLPILAAVLVTGAAMAAPQYDTIPAAKGGIKVHAFHHASLTLSWDGKLVLIDPAPGVGSPKDEDPAAAFADVYPDVILITHGHFDHFNVKVLETVSGFYRLKFAEKPMVILAPKAVFDEMPAALQAKTKVMANGDKLAAAGIPVEAVPAYNITSERLQFHPKGVGNGYVLTLGGSRVYVAGDAEETPEVAHLPNIEAAFLPMNLPYTQTVEAAAKWVKDFKPKRVYPYHFHGTDGSVSDLKAFAADVGTASEVKVLKWY
jgi:L-ascorbate metabolism protein UlaG (beta-lactamase superfamily)